MNASLAELNRAFWDLGLRFSWDEATFTKLMALPDLRAQLFQYLRDNHPHLLGVYDVEFLEKVIMERIAHPGHERVAMEAHRSV
jgi:hypothetical protein